MSSGVSTGEADRTTTVAFSGELDAGTSPILDEKLAEAIAGDYDKIVLDLSKLGFLDSAGLRSILRARTKARRAGKEFELVRPSGSVRRVLDVSGMG